MKEIAPGVCFIVLFLLVGISIAESSNQLLEIPWPASWEYRPPNERGSVVYLEARQRQGDSTLQEVRISALSISTATQPVDAKSIHGLAERLRDAVLPTVTEESIDVLSLSAVGYYFIATDRRHVSGHVGDYRQLVEGVMLRSEYLIHFTLLTNDATDASAKEILRALDQSTIE
ncbi:MAG TPA: hypothetical protein VIT67_13470 [Povalibacter sp.]